MRTDQGFLALFALLVGIALGIMFMQPAAVIERSPTGSAGQKTIVVESNASSPLPAIFDAAEDSVVSVRTEGPDGGSRGSGFVYDARGRIVTNEHVVVDATEVEVSFPDGSQYNARVVGTDPYTDLAVLDIDPRSAVRPLELGNASAVQVGERAAAIGNPFGLSGTMTAGIVSQRDRLLRTEGRFSIPGVFQTDAAINPGNSGGPLLNMEGKVIGVNTAITSGTRQFAGIGWAISVETVKRVVPELIADGEYRHPWIGVSGVDVTPEISEAMDLNVTRGFLVTNVSADSPAAEAGLRAGDREAEVDGVPLTVGGDVIVAIDGERVRKINDILNFLATSTEVGDTITLTVIRDGKRVDVELILDRRPQPG